MIEKDIYSSRPWEKFYTTKKDYFKDLQNSTLPEILNNIAHEIPNRPALNFQGFRLTYKELNQLITRMASGLKSIGLNPGDRVAVHLPNTIQCVISYYAILRAGGVVVMNNPLYTDRELTHQFNDSKAEIAITLDLFANRIINLRPRTGIRHIIYASLGEYLKLPKKILFKVAGKKKGLASDVNDGKNLYKFKEFIEKGSPDFFPPEISLDEEAIYQYTSGTTGVSKGAVLTQRNISINAQQVASWFPDFKYGDEKMIGALPFFHVFGMTASMNFAIVNGWELILVPKPEPAALLETIRKFNPTIAPLVPAMFIGMLNHKDIEKTDMSSIKGCFSGSAPLPIEIINRFEDKTGAIIVEGFGLTEASPVTHLNPFGKNTRKPGSIGVPFPDTECRITDIANPDIILPPGKPGHLCVKGPQVMKKYKGLREQTAAALKDGWLYTGDVATMDEDGYFYIVDRLKDMIISSGYNVYPREIEEVLYQNPKIEEACAVGIPHEKRGEQIKAFVILKEGETSSEAEIINYCTKNLAKYKLPTSIEFRDELPKNNVGKILKKELRKEFI